MSNFVSLEDAAKKLGVSTDELVEMLSRGEIFGYRDGSSWKFKPQEIERAASEMMGDALDEDPAGSSILSGLSDISDDSSGDGSGSGASSDVSVVAEPGDGNSDVRLVANSDEGSELSLADSDADLSLASDDDDDDELALAPEDDDILSGSDASNKSSGVGSDLEITGSDLELAADSEVIGSDLNLADSKAGSDASGASGALGSDLELAGDDDLVLGGGSDLALGSDSGINLMSPADSGISLEDEPLDLAASGISGLDLASESSDVESASSGGSAVDFQQDEEFQLSPSGSLDVDDDSGSQVIELEDSSEFGDGAVALPDGDEGFDAFSDVDGGGGLDESDALAPSPGAAAVMSSPEIPYSLLQVLSLLGILLLMCMSGILVTDVVRNMWAYAEGGSSLTSGFTSMVLSAFGQ